jgi:hypothetical protein
LAKIRNDGGFRREPFNFVYRWQINTPDGRYRWRYPDTILAKAARPRIFLNLWFLH